MFPSTTPRLVIAMIASAAPAMAQDVAPGDWPSYNRALLSDRYSPLDQITGENVGTLRQICSYDTGLTTSFQTGPIVASGTMFFTTEFDTFAIDAATCEERWRTTLDYQRAGPLRVNRGAALLDGRLFRGLQDGRLIALDAATGALLWEVQIGITDKGETIPAAPVAWDGKVFVGNAGGDNYGVKGRVYAFDATSGDPVWETFLVPKEQNVGTLTLVDAPISNDATDGYATTGDPTTWNVDVDEPITGGASWTSYTLDPAANGGRGLLYVPTANPAPDFISSLREGANLMTNSITVLDAQDGSYVRHHLMVPEDFHDWDASAAPAVVTTADGTRTVLAGAKDGNLHAFEDVSIGDIGGQDDVGGTGATGEAAPGGGQPASAVPPNKRFTRAVTTMLNVDAPLGPNGTYFCPGTTAGVMWNGPAYHADTNLAYVGSVDRCTTVTIADPENAVSLSLGQAWSGVSEEMAEDHAFGESDPAEES
ncbi:PQQ-binding-like beta-propeller repeat protein [Jannaschia sp. S6380]|uniref:outer membrane protein assembly factor BamB family protein n=1 Tax=Jannaschia sp. S6380 TaxID=2926408 RepID=UPI001FF474EF|nr:PQQ-binding-like beta-propeller repeat protein [Jannaschia sp. S6380]MCK0167255.1 PQQ-binding-like beta-propeller repeat protein [Jannaschia sp. S6380]